MMMKYAEEVLMLPLLLSTITVGGSLQLAGAQEECNPKCPFVNDSTLISPLPEAMSKTTNSRGTASKNRGQVSGNNNTKNSGDNAILNSVSLTASQDRVFVGEDKLLGGKVSPSTSLPSYLPKDPYQGTQETMRQAESSTSWVMNIDRHYLCRHPPRTFSSANLGNKELCDGKEGLTFGFNETYELCDDLYFMLYRSNKVAFFSVDYLNKNVSFKVYESERYANLCLPLYKRYNKCEGNKFATVCRETDNLSVVFVNQLTCPRPVDYYSSKYFEVYIVWYLVNNNITSLEMVCEGTCRIIDGEVNGVSFKLSNLHFVSLSGKSCDNNPVGIALMRERNTTMYELVNIYWPCCFAYYTVVWLDNPADYGLNAAWSYLPTPCRTGEVLLILMVGGIGASGVLGNLLVVMVMLSGGHRGQESCVLRTSLATADLLTALIVVVPAFFQHLAPFLNPPQLREWRWDDDPSSNYSNNLTLGFYKSDSGFPLLRSLTFSICSIVSVHTLCLLSFERFVLTTRPLRYREYISMCWVMLAITFIWLIGIINALLLASGENGISLGYNSMVKIPSGISEDSSFHSGGYFYFHILLAILLALSVASTIVFSTIAIISFAIEQIHLAAEMETLNMRVSRFFHEESRYIFFSQLMMTILFLLSVIPGGIVILFHLILYHYQFDMGSYDHLFEYLGWWFFLAATAWNPWLYNIRSHQFRGDAANTLRRLCSGLLPKTHSI
ncbi:uncharacterized protein LOC121871196 isoform X1 [Homarus americanus]|uniref:uncharacterized protein LOC121871196 isoform X1 n=1 Tax=Homarus americanus TaxID=6706 RepID=UPI001C489EC9|nr:uncharacterized protein LOC121871196 isoform X1 [Homarus americanus]